MDKRKKESFRGKGENFYKVFLKSEGMFRRERF